MNRNTSMPKSVLIELNCFIKLGLELVKKDLMFLFHPSNLTLLILKTTHCYYNMKYWRNW